MSWFPNKELIDMGPLTFVKDSFIAVDVENPETTPEDIHRFVGTVVGFDPVEGHPELGTLHLQAPDDVEEGHVYDIEVHSIVKGWWAPMGYRP